MARSMVNGLVLKNDQLYEGRDLALTTDFRDVFGEVAKKHLGTSNVQAVFPGYAASKGEVPRAFLLKEFRGLVRLCGCSRFEQSNS